MNKAKKALVYSSFPPQACGIGAYATEHVLYLKRGNYRVYTCSVGAASVGNYRVDLCNVRSIARLLLSLLLNRFDEIHVHYCHDLVFVPYRGPHVKRIALRIAQSLLLIVLGLKSGKSGSLIFHEICQRRPGRPLYNKLLEFAFSLFGRLECHTESERKILHESFPKLLKRGKTVLVKHERFMSPRYRGAQDQARRDLGIPKDGEVYLCIGFIQEHKGFHAAVEAFERSGKGDQAALYIVGSLRIVNEETLGYRGFLIDRISGIQNVKLVEKFVDDVEFDKWIRAADVVILPYKRISSSGVGARVLTLNRELFINSTTNLKDQFAGCPSVKMYETPEGLAELIKCYQRGETKKYSNRKVEGPNGSNKDSLLFVMPWFGPKVPGGAEYFIYQLCHRLAARGKTVEVWCTASSSIEGRNNDFLDDPLDHEAGFKIRRFRTNILSEPIFRRAHRRMVKGSASWLDGWLWRRSALYGRGMAEALESEHERFSSIHLCHYFGGSTHRLSGVVPRKTILHPFIHNEPPLFHSAMRDLFAGARGVICNSRAERTLAQSSQAGLLGERFKPIGNGIRWLEEAGHPPRAGARARGIVYVGRLIEEKNLLELVSWVDDYNKKAVDELDLYLIGEGPLADAQPIAKNRHVHVLGWLSEDEKRVFLEKYLALVQPSLLESFSLAMMEAWSRKTPVIVHGKCLATSNHVENSGGGFSVSSSEEFSEAIDAFFYDSALVEAMGEAGFDYAKKNYSWDAVLERFEQARAGIMNWANTYEEPEAKSRAPGIQYKFPEQLGTNRLPLDLTNVVQRPRYTPESKRFINLLGGNFYEAFELQFRETSATLRASWPAYASLIEPVENNAGIWVELGAGRGTFCQYLVDHGLNPSRLLAVEPDPSSYALLRKLPINSCSMTAGAFFEAVTANSIDVVSLLHVVEHIPWENLCILIKKTFNALKTGGRLIIETPDVNTLKTAAINFWVDPTHIRPLIAETLSFLLRQCGFKEIVVKTYNPHLNDAQMKELASRFGNDRIANELYGPQDLSLIALK